MRTSTMIGALAAFVLAAGCGQTDGGPGETETEAPPETARTAQAPQVQPISEDRPHERIPVIDAYHEGEKAWFIHTDVSDSAMAKRLTEMVGYRTLHSPRLGAVDTATVGKIYVFKNGVSREGRKPWGGGPFGYQIDILGSVPGDSGYTALRNPQLVTWKEGATPRILRSVAELEEAERNGELTIEATGVIVNAPVVKWPGDYLGGDARLEGRGARTSRGEGRAEP